MYLPIAKYRERIVKTVNENPVTIIVAETGSGKSTRVPQYLLKEGYSMMLAQPRRLAARAVAMRIAEEMGTELGGLVGLNTRYEKCFSPETRCIVATDGLILMRELQGQNRQDILILDEVHEWNLHTETLIALAKKVIDDGDGLKLVIMSATIDAVALSKFFGRAPVIVVHGRRHKIKRIEAGENLIDDATRCLKQGKNVLAFQPGKSEVADTVTKLREAFGDNAVILPLHAQLDASEQSRCFGHYQVPKCIVATNIAQTSITIDDIDAVVDSGLENRAELHGGVNGLFESVISWADSEQRMGRVGRTKPGIYIDHARFLQRDDYPMAEILRVKLDQMVLRLAWQGIAVEELSFFHQPPEFVLRQARKTLNALGCVDKRGRITVKGAKIANLPVSVESACMLLEAEQRGVLDDMLTIVAIYDVGGIVKFSGRWQDLCANEVDSDLLAQLEVYHAAKALTVSERREHTIELKSYEAVVALREFLDRVVRDKLDFTKERGDRRDLIASIAAGLKHQVFMPVKGQDQQYHRGDGNRRKLNHATVLKKDGLVVGQPWDVSGKVDGPVTQLLCLATKVDEAVLSSFRA